VLQLQPYPHGDFSWHHLWFIAYLFVYVPLLLPLVTWARRTQGTLKPGAWIVALSLPLGLNEAVLKPLYPEAHDLINDWYLFNHYLLLTAYGLILARLANAWDWLAQHRNRLLAGTLAVSAVVLGLLETGVVRRDTAGDAFLANMFTWMWLLTLLAYGRHFLSFDNRFLRWAREASYPFYILHQTFILIVAYWVIAMPWSAWVKFWCVLIATFALCALGYGGLVRRFNVLRLMFGMKTRGAPVTVVGAARRTLV
jgi:glucans biosynthesis protein C